MAIEIERKFLVNADALPELGDPIEIIQNNIFVSEHLKARVRITNKGSTLTIKSPRKGISRLEYEYDIPKIDAVELISNFCDLMNIEKSRYDLVHEGKLWSIDVFHGENEGLVMADIELSHENEEFMIPDWVEREITNVPEYSQAELRLAPYTKW